MRVRFARPAQVDLRQIYAYVSKDNPVEASRLVARLIERARSIGDTPYEGLRYFIFYMIAGDEVHITHIRHMSRRRPSGWQR